MNSGSGAEAEETALYKRLYELNEPKVRSLSEELQQAKRNIAEYHTQRHLKRVKQEKDDRSVALEDSFELENRELRATASQYHALIVYLQKQFDCVVDKIREVDGNAEIDFITDKDMEELDQEIRDGRVVDWPKQRNVSMSTDTQDRATSELVKTPAARPRLEDSSRTSGSRYSPKDDRSSSSGIMNDEMIPDHDQISKSQKSGLLSKLKARTGIEDQDLTDSGALSVDVQRAVVMLENAMNRRSRDKQHKNWLICASDACLFSRSRNTTNQQRWTRMHTKLYACLSCANMQQPCIRKGRMSNIWEILPLVADVRPATSVPEDEDFYIAADRRVSSKFFHKQLWQPNYPSKSRKRRVEEVERDEDE